MQSSKQRKTFHYTHHKDYESTIDFQRQECDEVHRPVNCTGQQFEEVWKKIHEMMVTVRQFEKGLQKIDQMDRLLSQVVSLIFETSKSDLSDPNSESESESESDSLKSSTSSLNSFSEQTASHEIINTSSYEETVTTSSLAISRKKPTIKPKKIHTTKSESIDEENPTIDDAELSTDDEENSIDDDESPINNDESSITNDESSTDHVENSINDDEDEEMSIDNYGYSTNDDQELSIDNSRKSIYHEENLINHEESSIINSSPRSDCFTISESFYSSQSFPNPNHLEEDESEYYPITPQALPLEYHPLHGLHSSYLIPLQSSFRSIGLVELHEELIERCHYDYGRGEKPPINDPLNHIFPTFDMLYNWSHLTPLDKVKVIILGNEPINKPDFTHGLAFSQSSKKSRVLGTMNNIHDELMHQFVDQSFQKPSHGSLVSWAKSGVLLLNIIQTTSRSPGTPHYGIGWERFTDEVLKLIDQEGGSSLQEDSKSDQLTKGLVFLVWGEIALKHINHSPIPTSKRNHLILKSQHPQPSTAHLGFLGSNHHHFRLTNEFLEKTYGTEARIDWCRLEKLDPNDVLKRNQ